MDIISHTLTGFAVGTVIAAFSDSGWKKKATTLLTGSFGGALPDFDAISLWSKFDATIGTFLNLSHSGKEIYFGKFWYSHHAALHSVFAPLFFIFLSIILNTFFYKTFRLVAFKKLLQQKKLYYLAFFFGFLFHLLEDMPTPASIWGGVNFFFPSENYIGGFGKIWWWNNYDLFLIIIAVIATNLLTHLLLKKRKSIACLSVFIAGMTLFLVQLNSRPIDFSYTGHTSEYKSYEVSSKQIQKEVLGEKLYSFMIELDNRIALNF